MAKKKYSIRGKIINQESGQGISDLKVEAWDKDLIFDDCLYTQQTNNQGEFRMEFSSAQFQEWFLDRKPDLYFRIFHNDKMIHSTEDQVIWNYDHADKEMTISINWPDKERFVVSGYIRTGNALAVPNLQVEVFDKKVGESESLGIKETNNSGYYLIDYTDRAVQLPKNESFDLFVLAYGSNNKVLAKSDLLIIAPKNVKIDLTVPNETYRGSSEYEQLHATIHPLVTPEKLKDLTDEDMEYIAAKLKLTLPKVKRYRCAWKLNFEANEFEKGEIPAEAFFGLISDADLPELKVLVKQSEQSLKGSLEAAVKPNTISIEFEPKIDAIVQILKEITVEIANKEPEQETTFTVKRMVKLDTKIPAEDQEGLIKNFALFEGTREMFVKELKNPKNEFHEFADSIEELFLTARLTHENLPLAKVLQEHIQNGQKTTFKRINDFAKNSTEVWLSGFLKDEVLEELPKDVDGEKISKEIYAQWLVRDFTEEFPMVHLAHRLSESDQKPSDEFQRFFDNNPYFNFEKVAIDLFWLDAKLEGIPPEKRAALQNELQNWQRIYKLLPESDRRVEQAITLASLEIPKQDEKALANSEKTSKNFPFIKLIKPFQRKVEKYVQSLKKKENIKLKEDLSKDPSNSIKSLKSNSVKKLDSATTIASIKKQDFIRLWMKAHEKKDSDTKSIQSDAGHIHSSARDKVFGISTLAWNYAAPTDAIIAEFIPPVVTVIPPKDPNGDPKEEVLKEAAANLTTLFGNQNYCECEHCQSIWSPAAYLVELYDILNQVVDSSGQNQSGSAPQTELDIRRPDLSLLELSCQNTETKLPYIDLVNELLEVLVLKLWIGVPPMPLEHQTRLEEAELAIRPEHTNNLAYVALTYHLNFNSLPWDNWYTEARLYLDYMELPLDKLTEAFLTITDVTAEKRRRKQLADESVIRSVLGITSDNYDLIIGKMDEKFYWSKPMTKKFSQIVPFMNLLGFWRENREGDNGASEFMSMREMLGTKYIQETKAQEESCIDIIFKDDCCDFDKAELKGVTKNTFLHIFKFEHLRYALGWKPYELHQAMLTLGHLSSKKGKSPKKPYERNKKVLKRISHLIRLQGSNHKTSTLELLSWWGPMNTNTKIKEISAVYESEGKDKVKETLYGQVFLEHSHFPPTDALTEERDERQFFELNDERSELRDLSQSISGHKAVIASALGIADSQIGELLGFIKEKYKHQLVDNLNLANLSTLYRFVSLARYLNLSLKELFKAIKLINHDPFDGVFTNEVVKTEETVLFVEAVAQIQHSPFSIDELAYLWHHKIDETELIYLKKQVYQFVKELESQLKESDQPQDNLIAVVAYGLQNKGFTKDEIDKTIAIIKGEFEKLSNEEISNEEVFELVREFIKVHFAKNQKALIDLLVDERPDLFDDLMLRQIIALMEIPQEEVEITIITNILKNLGLEKTDISNVIEIITKEPENPQEAKALLDQTFDFLSEKELEILTKILITNRDEPLSSEIYLLIRNLLLPYQRLVTALAEELGQFIGLTKKMVKKLLVVVLPGENGSSMIRDFAKWLSGNLKKDTIYEHMYLLQKLSTLINGWRFTAEEVVHIHKNKKHFQQFEWHTIPLSEEAEGLSFAQWTSLFYYVQVRDRISIVEHDVITFFEDVKGLLTSGGEPLRITSAVIQKLSSLLQINKGDARTIAEAIGYITEADELLQGALQNGESLYPVIELARHIKRLGCTAEKLLSWVRQKEEDEEDEVYLTLEASFAEHEISKLLPYKVKVVEEIRSAVKVRSGEKKWFEVAEKFQNQMRIQQRDRLLDDILFVRLFASKSMKIDSVENIYAELLIDPKMNPCMKTTRLKQAISSVQLFIHRLLMGLEENISLPQERLDELSREWKWKKNYRVWEAHKKVFVYPENWIEPELRDNKSPFFEEFEGDLAQGEIDDLRIEKAFKDYLKKVDEVGQLEVAAFHEDRDEFHIIGRTREKPRTHYYRKRKADIWEPWQRIDLDIDSDVVLLTMFNGTLYIFWPTIKERIQKLGQDNPDDKNNDKNNYLPVFEIRFNWSRYEYGNWQQKKKSDEYVELMYDWKYKELFEKSEELIRYRLYQISNRLCIETFIMGTLNRKTKSTWNEDKLSEIFVEAEKLPSRIDWTKIHGTDFNMGAKDIGPIVQGLINPIKSATYLHLYRNDLTKVIENLSQIFKILDFMIDMASHYDNVDGGGKQGLHDDDLKKITDYKAGYELSNESWLDQYIEFNSVEYTYALIANERLLSHWNINFGKIEFTGYKLKSKAFNGLGTQDSYNPKERHYFLNNGQAWNSENTIGFQSNSIVTKTETDQQLEIRFKYQFNPIWLLSDDESISRLTLKNRFSFEKLFYEDAKHNYYFEKTDENPYTYSYTTFFHPFIRSYNLAINDNRIEKTSDKFDKLLRLNVQLDTLPFPFIPGYLIQVKFEKVDFEQTMPFGLYNWEIFFHLPFTIAVRLSQNQQFEKAQEWFHYIFNPLASSLKNSTSARKYWNFKPLHDLGQPDAMILMMKILLTEDDELSPEELEVKRGLETQQNELAKDPFQPHRIARLRLGAYQKAVVMKYLDNLIAWGDHLFERDSIEFITEATHLYIVAARILGKRPKLVPSRKKIVQPNNTKDAVTLKDIYGYSRGMIKAETQLLDKRRIGYKEFHSLDVKQGNPSKQWYRVVEKSDNKNGNEEVSPIKEVPVFCVPHNKKLIRYWDTVANRLFKVRNCQNIEGQVRELLVFEPPIDPGLLVRGTALGIDISDLLSDLYAPLPPYRFRMMLQKAYEFCGDVRSLGGALLSALEKKDSEELSLLRAGHEKQLLKLTEQIKKQQIKELGENLKSAMVSLEMAEARFEYYNSRRFENQNEKQQVEKLDIANVFNIASQAVSVGASIAYLIPQIHAGFGPPTSEQGGKNLGDSISAVSKLLGAISSIYSHEANMHSIQGGRERRMDDWKFQAGQAKKEIKQLQKQILAAEIRINIAEKELTNHEQQIENAEEIETFMKSKFTNKQLYHWMISQVSGIYFQTYKLATDLAKQVQKCCRYEKGDDSLTYIGAAYWDNLKKGLLAGEKLQFDLRRMEEAYLRENTRELEITKSISLKALDPTQLHTLRYTGSCTIDIPELLFDLDNPGQYFRRIKSLSISIPAVIGPYSGVNCMLTLENSWTRKIADLEKDLIADPLGNDNQIALSSGQSDSGLFELNHNDERYLPFEYRGVISRWKLEFPGEYPQFDWSTITDVIFQMRYMARLGDSTFKDDVNSVIIDTYNTFRNIEPKGMALSLDIRRDFPDLWHQFTIGNSEENKIHELKLALIKDHFPYLLRPLNIKVTYVSLFCELNKKLEETQKVKFEVGILKEPSPPYEIILEQSIGAQIGLHLFNSEAEQIINFKISNEPTVLTIEAKKEHFSVHELKELIVILHFEVSK